MSNLRFTGNVFLLILFSVLLLMGGCSKPVTVQNITPDAINIVNRHPYSVNVTVKGDANLSDSRNKNENEVDREKVQQAIESSITTSGLFQSLASPEEADYLLEVVVFRANVKGQVTAKITTVVPMSWILSKREPRESVYQDRTAYEFTAKLREKLGGANRYTWANEGSVKMGIEQALSDISKLKL